MHTLGNADTMSFILNSGCIFVNVSFQGIFNFLFGLLFLRCLHYTNASEAQASNRTQWVLESVAQHVLQPRSSAMPQILWQARRHQHIMKLSSMLTTWKQLACLKVGKIMENGESVTSPHTHSIQVLTDFLKMLWKSKK